MAEPMSLIHFGSATKNPLSKPKESENRPQSSRDHQPPPPKKVRSEEKSFKPKKVNGEGGGGEEKQHQKQQSYGSPTTWSVSPVKPSSPALPPPPPALHKVHSVFKQSAFLASPPKPKKLKEKREHEKEREKEKRKHKLESSSSSSSLGSASAAMKKENGELKLLQKGNAARAAPLPPAATLTSARDSRAVAFISVSEKVRGDEHSLASLCG